MYTYLPAYVLVPVMNTYCHLTKLSHSCPTVVVLQKIPSSFTRTCDTVKLSKHISDNVVHACSQCMALLPHSCENSTFLNPLHIIMSDKIVNPLISFVKSTVPTCKCCSLDNATGAFYNI